LLAALVAQPVEVAVAVLVVTCLLLTHIYPLAH